MSIEVGSIIDGKVVRIKPFGAIVLVGGGMQGLVHISHISDEFVQDINDHLSVGDVVSVKVLSIDAQNNKISLSIKEANAGEGSQRESASPQPVNEPSPEQSQGFEEKFKDWLKASNERQAGINKRNKRR